VVVPELSRRDFENLLAFRNGLRRFIRWSETQARDAGLTPAQHQLLVAVKGHRGDGYPTISDLAGYLLLRHHSVVELVDRAVTAGIVSRQPDARDGRVTRIRLTPDGEARLSRLAAAHLDELRNLAPVLDHLVADWASHAAGLDGSRAPGQGQDAAGGGREGHLYRDPIEMCSRG
jgi:DNA-binding MarR family transcriptional regulator